MVRILLPVLCLLTFSLGAADSHFLSVLANGADFDPDKAPVCPGMEVSVIQRPDKDFKFLHDTAVTEFKGKLYAAWYNCPEKECQVTSVIRGRVSADGGKTWSETVTMAADANPEWQYVPPAFARTGDNLYLLVPHHCGEGNKQTLHIFKLDESSGKWKFHRELLTAFLPNTCAETLENGTMILAGRNTLKRRPAVLIFDKGTPEGDWHEVSLDGNAQGLPPEYACPESSLTVNGNQLFCFVRCQQMITFWVYVSNDGGETWQQKHHELPVLKSKMASGKLSDGRYYFVFNIRKYGRNRLYIAFSEKGEMKFRKFYTLRADNDPALNATPQWSYPSAVEYNGKLYITCTCRDASPEYRDIVKSAAALIIIPLDKIR